MKAEGEILSVEHQWVLLFIDSESWGLITSYYIWLNEGSKVESSELHVCICM